VDALEILEHVGNGNCDWVDNKEECGRDGGDCENCEVDDLDCVKRHQLLKLI